MTAWGQPPERDSARHLSSSWYSTDEDRLVPPSAENSRSIDVSDRNAVLKKTAQNNSTSNGAYNWLSDLISSIFDVLGPSAPYLALTLIALSIGAIVIFIIVRMRPEYQLRKSKRDSGSLAKNENEKIVDLPFELDQLDMSLLAQIERLIAAGDFSKAFIYLFSHILIELDSSGMIRLERGKTNRSYLREVRDNEKLRGYLGIAIRHFESVFFGRKTLTPAQFQLVWEELPAMKRYLAELTTAKDN